MKDADGTLIIARGGVERLTGGTALTCRLARQNGRPMLAVDPADADAAQAVKQWLDRHAIRVLNVAGPRASVQPDVAELAAALLRQVLGPTIKAT